ncbi:MAG: hypothetical protein QXL10_00325 [Candidatus Bathyarchaeia archaeon]
MAKPKSKIGVLAALSLLFAMLLVLVTIPAITAQIGVPYVSTGTFQTKAFIGAVPNPVGVGQEVLLHVGIQQQLAIWYQGWEGLSVTIERPDGVIEKIENIRTDSTGGTGVVYVPTMVGNYILQSHFPEQRMPQGTGGIPTNCTMLASDSPKLVLKVQQEPIPEYPAHPLPSEYWTRPINAQHWSWAAIAGSSWHDNEFNAAPDSPHVLWTKPYTIGGLVGGELGDSGQVSQYSFEHGDAYEGKFSNRLILAGRLYYTLGPYERPVVTYCVDLRTGETIWEKVFMDNRTISFGQLYYWDSYNYHGTFEYLWITIGSDWYGFDGFTGEHKTTFFSMPSGTRIEGPKGEFYIYSISLTTGRMTLWNQSAFVSMSGSWGSQIENREYNVSSGYYRTRAQNGSFGSWTTTGATDRINRAWALNFTFPTVLPGSVRGVKLNDKVFGSYVGMDRKEVNLWAFSLKPGEEGRLLYNKTWPWPASWIKNNATFATYGSSWAYTNMDENFAAIWIKEELSYYTFNITTGDFMWKQEYEQQTHLDTYSIGCRIYQGKFYTVGQGGMLHCFDATNGKLLWIYNATDPYNEFLWGPNWSLDILFNQGGKLYLFHSEHSPVNPLFRGAPAICINATTGEIIWRVDGLFRKTDWGGGPIMGDSVIVLYNSYDQRLWAIGKGPSSTTVTASPKVSVHGSRVLVEGKVVDVSPGTKDSAVTMRFPKGVPAVSDESVGDWMKYVYAQFPRPADVKGVEVVVSVLDPNNNCYEVGRTTTDENGFYSLAFEPPVPGKYKILAIFEGSNSYYGSYDETAVFVEDAPPASPAPTPTPTPLSELYFIPAITGIIIAIIVVGILLALLLIRKK